MSHRIVIVVISLLVIFVMIAVGEYVYIQHDGKTVPAPTIPREILSFGTSGPKLRYAVMGDSTSIGQGARYEQSYSYQSAEQLGKTHQVQLLNVGISGAVAKDLITTQLDKVEAFKPDIVLIAVGANDVTHFTSNGSFRQSLQTIIDGLRAHNPALRIVVTGSPAMGAVHRFPPGAKQLAGYRTRQINQVYAGLITKNHLTLAPVAERTGPAFNNDPTLFAQDNFHPNARGYALWTPVINEALATALAQK